MKQIELPRSPAKQHGTGRLRGINQKKLGTAAPRNTGQASSGEFTSRPDSPSTCRGRIGIKCIIFDLDGTLIDSGRDIINSVNHSLRKLNLRERDDEFILSNVGYGGDSLLRRTLDEEYLGKLQELKSAFREYYSQHLLDNTVLYPGVKDILEHFRNKRKIIVTNRITRSANKLIESLGVKQYFEDVYGGDNGAAFKPSPELLIKAIKRMGVDNKEVIMVGDMEVDVQAGRSAGVMTCGVTYGIGRKKKVIDAKPDYLINHILELKEIIR